MASEHDLTFDEAGALLTIRTTGQAPGATVRYALPDGGETETWRAWVEKDAKSRVRAHGRPQSAPAPTG
jgi:hypothetical protein